MGSTNLDIQENPVFVHPGLRQVLEQVEEAGHGDAGLPQRPQRAQELPVAVGDLLLPSKAAGKGGVL